MIRRLLLCCLAVAMFVPGASLAQCVKKPAKTDVPIGDNVEKFFIDFPYRSQVLTQDQAQFLNQDYGELSGGMAQFARAIIFGRHGRVFQDPDTQSVLKDQKWYEPNPKFSNSMLDATERTNLDIVRGQESEQHSHVMPGDLRFWETRDIPQDQVWQLSIVELHVMRAEIEAIHGKRFEDEPFLEKYFEDRYWYQPAAHYDPKTLNSHERKNMELLAMAEAKKSGDSLVPGALLAYGEKAMTPQMLKNLNLYQLRLLRNEVYAIRGATFHTKWIQDHFNGEDWYSPLAKGAEPQLTSLDQKNVALILKRENLLHQNLSTAKIKTSDLAGMLSDDAGRLSDEIYARRGKVFRDKWLQSYFGSLPWYKANPSFSDKMLSPVERANIQTIARYEKAAVAKERMTEG